ncbi:MAG: GGDEF domain-containing protein [Endomicrobiales bacterium]
MIPVLLEKKAVKEITQSVIVPLISGLAFLIWFYYFMKSPSPRLLIFPFSGVILVVLYFFSGWIQGGILLAFLTVIGILSVFVTSSPVSRLVFPLETLWLWGLFLLFEYYRTSSQTQQNRIREEEEVLETRITLQESKVEDNQRRSANLTQRISHYQSLGRMTQTLGSVMEEEEIPPLIAELATRFIGKGTWKVKKGFHNDVFASYVKSHRLPLIIRDLTKDSRFYIRHPRFLSMLAVPLEAGDRYWGVLKGVSAEPEVFDEGDLRSLSVLCGIASLALNNARLYQKTQELAITDGLTGLYVQSYFRERLSEELLRSRSHALPLSIALIDIDLFKRINDTYGHAVGDTVLRQVAALLRGRLRETDFVARYGGEEFGVIMPQTDYEEAGRVAEEIRKSTQSDRFFLPIESFHPVQAAVTVSIGVTSVSGKAMSGDEMVHLADKALYQAKDGGRNRVVCCHHDRK